MNKIDPFPVTTVDIGAVTRLPKLKKKRVLHSKNPYKVNFYNFKIFIKLKKTKLIDEDTLPRKRLDGYIFQ